MNLLHVDAHFDRLLTARDYPKTICPSEVARAMSAEELSDNGAASWRDLMSAIREYTFDLRDQDKVEILQKGNVLPRTQGLKDTAGPIRVRKAQ